jgi:hypothetical protein
MSGDAAHFAVQPGDVAEVVRIIRLHVPAYPAEQMIRELYRSRAAERAPAFKLTMFRLSEALALQRPPESEGYK